MRDTEAAEREEQDELERSTPRKIKASLRYARSLWKEKGDIERVSFRRRMRLLEAKLGAHA